MGLNGAGAVSRQAELWGYPSPPSDSQGLRGKCPSRPWFLPWPTGVVVVSLPSSPGYMEEIACPERLLQAFGDTERLMLLLGGNRA